MDTLHGKSAGIAAIKARNEMIIEDEVRNILHVAIIGLHIMLLYHAGGDCSILCRHIKGTARAIYLIIPALRYWPT